MKKTLTLILALTLALIVVACGGGGNDIVGKWTPILSDAEAEALEQMGMQFQTIMEFKSNGQFESYVDVKGEGTLPFDTDEMKAEGTYKVDGDKVTVTAKGATDAESDSFTATYKVEGDKLTLSVTDSEVDGVAGSMELTRVK